MARIFDVSRVPGATTERHGDTIYESDYWRAYGEAWKIAWLSACRDDRLQGCDVAVWADGMAHAIASGFADLQSEWRQVPANGERDLIEYGP